MSSRLVHAPTGRTLARDATRAEGFLSRLVGWIGREIPPGAALGITACRQIHTFGVRAPLDCAYCARDGRTLHIQTLAPNRIGPWVRDTWIVWEAATGAFTPFVRTGDRLQLIADTES